MAKIEEREMSILKSEGGNHTKKDTAMKKTKENPRLKSKRRSILEDIFWATVTYILISPIYFLCILACCLFPDFLMQFSLGEVSKYAMNVALSILKDSTFIYTNLVLFSGFLIASIVASILRQSPAFHKAIKTLLLALVVVILFFYGHKILQMLTTSGHLSNAIVKKIMFLYSIPFIPGIFVMIFRD